jgi:DNA-directed RNA polymerase specialized sigma24 family protein
MGKKEKTAKNSKEHYYVNPKEFRASLRVYYDTDIMTNDLAENIKKIAYGLSYNSSFINYSYRDDMIGDALIKMYSALSGKKYNFDKTTTRDGKKRPCNPFSYFTTIAFNAFVNRIKKEKRHYEAEKQYREKVYEDIMMDSESGDGVVYVKPGSIDEDDFYDDNR